MQGLALFVVFFSIFLVSSLLIPSPLFPGNFLCLLVGIDEVNHALFVSALTNGIFYGFFSWLISNLSFKLVKKSISKNKLSNQ